MEKREVVPESEYGPGNPEFKPGQRVYDKIFKNKGTIVGVGSGAHAGNREVYEVLLDNPLTLGGHDRQQYFDFDQIDKLL